MRERALIACLSLEPLALWHAVRKHPQGPLAVTDAGKVRHVNHEAHSLGVEVGMRTYGALSRAPELHLEPLSPALLGAQWEALLEALFAYSPKIELLSLGRVLLTLRESQARELASALHPARIGLAGSRELAVLAALTSRPMQPRMVEPPHEAVFLRALPLRVLAHVGLSKPNLARLEFLGLRSAGDLLKWSRAQQQSVLGHDAQLLRPYLHGPRGTQVLSFRSASEVEARFCFEEPAREPYELEPVIALLAEQVAEGLAGKAATRLRLSATVIGARVEAAREAKESLRDPRAIQRLATLTLQDGKAAELGIDELTLTLSGLHRPARQGGLWQTVGELEVTRQVLARFPDALVRAEWRNVHSFAFQEQFAWVHFVSGEDVLPKDQENRYTGRVRNARTPQQRATPGGD